MAELSAFLAAANAVLWHEYVLYAIVATGLLFTVWSGFSQYYARTHGPKIVRGVYDDAGDPGAINHFQALSAALSATVGLGNIGGVALAIALGGPGAMFWMWVIAVPHGGPMWVVSRGLARQGKPRLGKAIAVVFCVCLLVSTSTGGNMFQAWNVGELTQSYFGVPSWVTGIVLAVVVGSVIIGGIKRIGRVAGAIVPFMVVLYLAAGAYVLAVNIADIPAMLVLIVKSAFMPTEAAGAFIGGTAASAFLYGLKRAAFSNEAGQGSSPIAHAAARTDEPVREGIVAGLEPFIDTIVVCTFTALIILSTGIWNRGPDVLLDEPPVVERTADGWQFGQTPVPGEDWFAGDKVTTVVEAGTNPSTGLTRHRLEGTVLADGGGYAVAWNVFPGSTQPTIVDDGLYRSYIGATLTARAFDTVAPGLGKWLVSLAAWLFAVSTMISWSYYGEQGMVYLAGDRSVLPYKLVYCLLIVVATLGFIKTDSDLDNLTGVGTAVMLFANIPITLLLGHQAMRAYKDYIARLKSGREDQDPFTLR